MNILILTGPPASGKNTISQVLSQKKAKCAIIDVDFIRWMYRRPHKAPWEGEEGKVQQKLGVENACLLAKHFAENNINVIILDVVVNETAKLYKKLLPKAKIAFLMPSFEETHKRFIERLPTISEEEFKLVYEWEEQLIVYDKKIDNTFLSPEQTTENLSSLF